jgi:hypothetical protein
VLIEVLRARLDALLPEPLERSPLSFAPRDDECFTTAPCRDLQRSAPIPAPGLRKKTCI